ncbi:MAG: hypothetical protein PHO80_01470 [Candidatus Gracilibacteria bacterium]|nr:hypothetical protein [Candidatus Gracilibacteria bacterium]
MQDNEILDKVNFFIEKGDTFGLYKLVDSIPNISVELANKILKKIINYTNGYRNHNTTSKILKIAGKLYSLGAQNEQIFIERKEKTLPQIKAWGEILKNIETYKDSQIVGCFVDETLISKYGLEEKEIFRLLDEFIITLGKPKLVFLAIKFNNKIKFKINSKENQTLVKNIYSKFNGDFKKGIMLEDFTKDDVVGLLIDEIM